jgi:hypothetical protein
MSLTGFFEFPRFKESKTKRVRRQFFNFIPHLHSLSKPHGVILGAKIRKVSAIQKKIRLFLCIAETVLVEIRIAF